MKSYGTIFRFNPRLVYKTRQEIEKAFNVTWIEKML